MKRNFSIYILSFLLLSCKQQETPPIEPMTYNYVSVGDSYTEGTGVNPKDAWPVLLTNHLQSEGVDITLKKNLGKSGAVTTDVLQYQLPKFKEISPNFATVFIGANDIFRQIPIEDFQKKYNTLLDEVLLIVEDPKNVLVATIPDYSLTPTGITYARGRSIKTELTQYNNFIEKTAKQRGLPLVDLHATSKSFMLNISLVSEDGLHPSRKGHELWEEKFYKTFNSSR